MTTATLATPANQDRSHAEDIIRAVYRQVFGNRHLMELDVQPSIEALFINGDLTVQGLVTALAQSESYRRLFLETNNPCLLYTSPSPRDRQKSRMPSSA